jgi:hypothetical protein
MTGAKAFNDAVRLSDLLAAELVKRLKAGECKECGRTAASDKDLANMIRFLKDNGITVGTPGAEAMTAVTKDLPFTDPEDVNP